MGLFSNKNKPCPICGNATPRLLPDTVEGMPICKGCAKKRDMPDQMFEGITVDRFRQYITFHQENQPLRDRFQQTFFWNDISLDVPKKLFRVNSRPEALVMEASCLRSFRILEDGNVLFESGPQGLVCYESGVPARIQAAELAIMQFRMQREQYHHMKRMEEERRRKGAPPPPYISEPLFDYKIFQKGFGVEFSMEHPYWGGTHSWDVHGPVFDITHPSSDDFLREYEREVNKLHELGLNLMRIMGLNATDVWGTAYASDWGGGAAQASSAADPVAEIQKYKALLDSGAITEEEFAAKKRLLMGI